MKITLDIPDGVFCAFLNGVQLGRTGLEMFSHQLDSEDLVDGKTTKLPRNPIGEIDFDYEAEDV